jgi:hypothetical protein
MKGGAPRRWLGPALAGLLAVLPTLAAATPPSTLTLAGARDACPSPALVAASLWGLLRATRVTVADPGRVRIEDHGERYRIRVDADAREIEDPARDCAERARVAAVLIALTLDSPPVIAPPAPPPRANAPGPAALRLQAAAGALAVGAPGVDVTGGAELRLALGGARVGGTFGVAAGSPARLPLGPGSADVLRVPFDLGLYATVPIGRLEAVAEAGVVLAAVRVGARDVDQPRQLTRPEVGLRAAVGVRCWWHPRVGGFAAFAAQVVPSPDALLLDPLGVATRLPRLWLAFVAGVITRAP